MPSITVSFETLARMVEVYVGGGESSKSAYFKRNLANMTMLFKPLLALSLLWNFVLVAGVILNQNFALARAAGGQFDAFPAIIRIAYFINLMIVTYQALIFFTDVKRPHWIYKIFLILGILSVVVNALSRSPLERWNAIPAAVIAFGFFHRNFHQMKFSA